MESATGGPAKSAKSAAAPPPSLPGSGPKGAATGAHGNASAAGCGTGPHGSAKQSAASAPASTTSTPSKTFKTPGNDATKSGSVREAAAAEEVRAAVAAAARALDRADPQEEDDGGALGVSYDLLTAVTERLDDVALFEPTQTDEEGLTAVLTTGVRASGEAGNMGARCVARGAGADDSRAWLRFMHRVDAFSLARGSLRQAERMPAADLGTCGCGCGCGCGVDAR